MMAFRWWDVKKEWWDNTAAYPTVVKEGVWGRSPWLRSEGGAEAAPRCKAGRGEPDAGRSVRARAGGRVRYHRDQ